MSGYPSLNYFFHELTERFRTFFLPDCALDLDIPSQIDDWEDTETRLVKIKTSGVGWLNFLNQLLGPGLVYSRKTSSSQILTQWKVQRNNRNHPRFKNIIDESPNSLYLRGTGEREHHWRVVPQLLIRFDKRSPNWFSHFIWNTYWKGPENVEIMAYETGKMRPRTNSDLPLSYWHSPQLEDLAKNPEVFFLVPEFSMIRMGKPVTIVLGVWEEVWRARYAKESVSLAWSLSISAIK